MKREEKKDGGCGNNSMKRKENMRIEKQGKGKKEKKRGK